MRRLVRALALAVAIGGGTLTADPARSQEAREIARHGAWAVLAVGDGGDGRRSGGLCFIAAQPHASQPTVAGRGEAYVYVSAWPKEGVKAEVSVANGYTFRKGSTVTVTIGSAGFVLFTTDTRAFVADPTAELKLLDAMKKAQSMRVDGITERGIITHDTYALAGLVQALAAITRGCG